MSFNFDLNTKGLTISERYELIKHQELIPIGTVCFKAGSWLESTEETIVTEDNQKIVTMLWNFGYFLEREKAEMEENISRAQYAAWLGRYNTQGDGSNSNNNNK